MSRRASFTLTELMVVVGILSVLATLLGSALKTVREHARSTVCLCNLRQLGMGIRLYANEFNEHMPYPSAFGYGSDFAWYNAIDPYLFEKDVGTQRTTLVKQDPIIQQLGANWQSNAHTLKMNQNLGLTNSVKFFASYVDIPIPTSTVLLFDGRAETDPLASGDPGPIATRFDGTEGYVARRHFEHANVLFVDGHAEIRYEKKQTTGTGLGWEVNETSLIWKP